MRKYGSNERNHVQKRLKRISGAPRDARIWPFCTLQRSFDAKTHVTFAKKTESSLEPFTHVTQNLLAVKTPATPLAKKTESSLEPSLHSCKSSPEGKPHVKLNQRT